MQALKLKGPGSFNQYVDDEGVYTGPEIIEGHLALNKFNTIVRSLGTLKVVRGSLSSDDSTLTDLGNLSLVCGGDVKGRGGNFQLRTHSIKSLGKLNTVTSQLDLVEAESVTDLGCLEYVLGTLHMGTACWGKVNLLSFAKLKKVKDIILYADKRLNFPVMPDALSFERVKYYYPILGTSTLVSYGEYWGIVAMVESASLTDLIKMRVDAKEPKRTLIALRLKGEQKDGV